MKKMPLFLLPILLTALAGTTAHTAVRKGAFRLSLDQSLFGYSVGELEPDGGGERDFDNVTVGLGLPHAGIGLGGSLGGGWVFGVRVTLGLRGEDDALADADSFLWGAVPYLEYVFLNGVFRPFLTVLLGVEGVVDERGGDDAHLVGVIGGGGGGAHFFFGSQLSLDLALLAHITGGGGEQGNRDYTFWRFSTMMLLGLSGWFG